MDAVEYLKAKGIMARACTISCYKCPFDNINNSKDINCVKFENEYPKQAVEMVEKWAKEIPIKTYLSVLLEKLPNAYMEGEIPKSCPYELFNIDNKKCPRIKCVECWNRPYMEEE